MKIAILTSGILPVPAVKGGAVENLIDFYLEYNDRHQLHDITVYSVADMATNCHPAMQSEVNHYYYICVTSLWAKVHKHLYHFINRHDEYYHYTIEYFLHQAIKHICKHHYDVIILENRPGYSLLLKGKTTAKLIYHLHNEKLSCDVPNYQIIYSLAFRILTVSDYIKSRVLTINPADTKTKTIHNGINLDAFIPNDVPSARIAKGFSKNDFIMVFSGRITKEKGIMELIEAMLLLGDYPQIKLLVLGSSFYGNSDNMNNFAKALKNKAAPLSDRIIFTGFIPYDQMPSFLRIADIAVIPSVWEDPFPTTVLEAQAMGLPIIATNRGGIPEEVTEENAILIDTDSLLPNRLAEAIRHLYDHPKKRKAMSEAAIRHSRLFDKDKYAQNFFASLI